MRKSKRIKYDGTIKKIYHIADVHIRNLKRHKEYREVFENLYDYIKSSKTDDGRSQLSSIRLLLSCNAKLTS